MKHEKIFKREDGSQVKVEVRLHLSDYYHRDDEPFRYSHMVFIKGFRKKNWIHKPYYKEDYGDEIVTDQEITETKLELWEKLKP